MLSNLLGVDHRGISNVLAFLNSVGLATSILTDHSFMLY
jgi:hypothetical protein